MQTPEETLTYEDRRIASAIRNVQRLLEKSRGKASIEDFYLTMEEVLTTMEETQGENKTLRRAFDKLCSRVEIMERLLALHCKQ